MEERTIQNNLYSKRQYLRFQKLKGDLVTKKIAHPLILGSIILFSLLCASAIALFGARAGAAIFVLFIALPLIYIIVAYPKAGITFTLFLSFFLLWVSKFGIEFPVGTMMDGLLALLIIGFLVKQKYKNDWTIFKNPISIMVLVWIGYNLLEVANPVAESRLAWVYTVRTVAVVLLMYFIFLYHIRTVTFVRFLLKVWIALSLFAALYAIKQELFGFFPFEEKWLAANPISVSLYYINGVWRKFSIFSDPVTFSYNMVISSMLCIALITGPLAKWKKGALIMIALTCLLAMVFSGTRGAYVLPPVALGLLCVLRFNKRILLVTLILGGILSAVIIVPSSNKSIQRFQSAFFPSFDASYNIRKTNQKMIQPYILSHPIGGGLGATGMWGNRFSPNSFLANFPPDSGYVRVAVELGWVGLFIFCTLMFIILKTGITNYYKIKDPELKSYCLGMILVAFALNIGNFPQEALVQYPTNILFSLVLALMNSTLLLDRKQSKILST